MSWLQRIAQRFVDTGYWGQQFHHENPQFIPQFDIYQSSDFPHVFLGGADDLDEAQSLAGQPICKIVDCRDLPEVGREASWDYSEYLAAKTQFDAKVRNVIRIISSTQCPIFIHCALGANRSVSVLAAALSQLTGKSVHQILGEMKQVRSLVSPQDPYYLMALEHSPESPEFKRRRFDELDQDFPLLQPTTLTAAAEDVVDALPDDLRGDLDLLWEERQHMQAFSTPGSLVRHREHGWTGTVKGTHGNPFGGGGKVLVEHPLSFEQAQELRASEGDIVQRFYSTWDLEPVMKMVSPFRRASWLGRVAEVDFAEWDWQETEGDLDVEPFVQNFGLTTDVAEAGYILPDGRMLDFSGKSHGWTPGRRGLDHREPPIGEGGMVEFMRRSGAVRFGFYQASSAHVDYFSPLTFQQERVITRLIPRLDYLHVDIRDGSGRIIFSESGEGRIEVARLWRSVQGH